MQISISGWFGQRRWGIGKDGFAYIRYAHNWQLLDRPKETPLKLVRVGIHGVWAVGTNNALYRRSDVMPILPEGREWVKACDGVTQVRHGTWNFKILEKTRLRKCRIPYFLTKPTDLHNEVSCFLCLDIHGTR